MGFKRLAIRSLETGSRAVASHAISNGDVVFVFSSPLRAPSSEGSGHSLAGLSKEDMKLMEEMHKHIATHGDAVKDVAFEVDDAAGVYNMAVSRGAVGILKPHAVSDEFGEVVLASIKTYGDTTHTFVEKGAYRGGFLPEFKAVEESEREDPLFKFLPDCSLQVVDHCVGNQDWDGMEEACDL
jgi:4-hydroxyphenylpyruvate dioxygenase